MNNETFIIEDYDLEQAQHICKYINNPEIRNRAVANSLAANIAKKYFVSGNVDTESGLHNVSQVLNDIEISDIYVNGAYIDVRLYFNDNELCVPKRNFDDQLLPVVYMFINIAQDLSGGTVTGFLPPSSVNTEESVDGYYPVDESSLVSFYDVESLLTSESEMELPANFKHEVFDYLDGKLEDKTSFYRLLVNSQEGRLQLIKAAKVQNIFNFVSLDRSVESNEDDKFVDLVIDDNDEQMHLDVNSAPVEPVELLEIEDTVTEDNKSTDEQTVDDSSTEEPLSSSFSDVMNESEQAFDNFTTEITPNLESDENESIDPELDVDEPTPINENADFDTEEGTDDSNDNNETQIDTLFNSDNSSETVDSMDDSVQIQKTKKAKSALPIIGVVAIFAAIAYFGFNKFYQHSETLPAEQPLVEQSQTKTNHDDAMPVETVENINQPEVTNEGTSVSIPAIEQNLDTSILVSNLTATWEVPAGYVTNNTAKRYFTKLGKIIQLNLKTELLLLSKPPITNRIAVEFEYNKGTHRFDVKGLVASSGEKVVDDVILATVKKALDVNLNINTNSFGVIQGNPILIIRF